MVPILSFALGLSLTLNAAVIFFLVKLRKQIKQKQPDANAQEVLAELLSGPAVVRIEVIEKNSLIQWRPN